jgi:S-adenosylmethionine hydrolase
MSATFHGRDLFAPVAAALARGEPLAGAGDPIGADELTRLALPVAERRDGELVAHVLLADRFGNVILDASHDDLTAIGLRLGAELEVRVDGRTHRARFVSTFVDVGEGELLLYEDAQRQLALAVNRGSARDALGVGRDAELRLTVAG